MDRRMVLASGALFSMAALAKARAETPPETPAGLSVDAHVVLDAFQALVEEHLQGVLTAARTLAVTSDAKTADWTRLRPPLAELAAQTPTAAAIWFARPDGSYSTVAEGRVAANVKDRDYFPTLMAGHDVRASLVVSKSTGHRSIVVATPVARGGKVVGAIGASIRARLIAEMVERRAKLPPNYVFYALDAHGRAAIHKDPALMFTYPSDLGDPSLKAAVAAIFAKPSGAVDYGFRGSRRTALFETSEYTGWRFVLAAVLAQ